MKGSRHASVPIVSRVALIALVVGLQFGCATHSGKSAEEVGKDTRGQIVQGAKDTGETLENVAHEAGDTIEQKSKGAGKSLKKAGHNIRDFFKGLFGID